MKTYRKNRINSAVLLLMSALFVASAYADNEEIAALTQPKSSVEVEAIGVNTSSAKFGEYNTKFCGACINPNSLNFY